MNNPYLFTGRRWDDEVNLYYFRARHQSPSLGRFIQRDPIGFWGGPNPYWYGANDPVNMNDPLGLFYFGKRRLKGLPFMFNHPVLDKLNRELSHEHGFFEDNVLPSNIGFGPKGGLDFPSFCGEGNQLRNENPIDYAPSSEHFDDTLMRQALDNVTDDNYCLMGNNCQDWAQRLRDEYYRLKDEQN